MNADLIPLLLLLLFGVALSTGGAMVTLVLWRARHNRPPYPPTEEGQPIPFSEPGKSHCFLLRPSSWMAIKNGNLLAVQSAFGLHNTKPCSWMEGLAAEEKLFIAPAVKGWTLVIGSGLPEPSEDVDACFRFVVGLSRQLGHVQYFSASRVLHHHAWVQAEGGRVVRAYAWAGKTLWKQGPRTSAEKELDVRCFDYADPAERASFSLPDAIAANVDKVPMLAARWSLDPAGIDERCLENECGIAGEPSRRY